MANKLNCLLLFAVPQHQIEEINQTTEAIASESLLLNRHSHKVSSNATSEDVIETYLSNVLKLRLQDADNLDARRKEKQNH